jgi:hypothetical protein
MVTETHQRAAGVEGEIRNVGKEAKRRSEGYPEAASAQIMHIVPEEVQGAEAVRHLTAGNSSTRNINTAHTKNRPPYSVAAAKIKVPRT